MSDFNHNFLTKQYNSNPARISIYIQWIWLENFKNNLSMYGVRTPLFKNKVI